MLVSLKTILVPNVIAFFPYVSIECLTCNIKYFLGPHYVVKLIYFY